MTWNQLSGRFHFPQERSVGRVLLIPGVNTWKDAPTSDPVIVDAKGEVVFDDATSLRLTLHEKSVDDLSWMDQLGPRDIQSLNVTGNRITDTQLRHLSNLAALESLEL